MGVKTCVSKRMASPGTHQKEYLQLVSLLLTVSVFKEELKMKTKKARAAKKALAERGDSNPPVEVLALTTV
jgi:hypothetical protein